MTQEELKAANRHFADKKPLCRFFLHKRTEPFYGNVIGIDQDEKGFVTYSVAYQLAGAPPDERPQMAIVPMSDVELLKTVRPGFWAWLKSLFQ